MTVEETAQKARDKTLEIRDKALAIVNLVDLVLARYELNSDVFEFPTIDKQKLIQHYQTKKAELKALVNELP